MIVLIPARIGSKGVPLKNLRDLGGYPLIAWSIAAGRLLGYPTFVSTDSEEISGIANNFCPNISHLRRNGGGDIQTDRDVVEDFIINHKSNIFDTDKTINFSEIIYLRPTTPLRDPNLIKRAVEWWKQNKADSLCSGHYLPESADKYFRHGEDSRIIPYNPAIKLNDLHKPNQQLTQTIKGNGVIDIFRTDKIGQGILWGSDMLGFITPPTVEIDTEEDLDYCRWRVEKYGHPLLDYMKAVYE